MEMLSALVGIIGTALLGVIGWAFSLQSRVSVLEADKVSLRELLDAKLENISGQVVGVTIRLDRIERKLDREEE